MYIYIHTYIYIYIYIYIYGIHVCVCVIRTCDSNFVKKTELIDLLSAMFLEIASGDNLVITAFSMHLHV